MRLTITELDPNSALETHLRGYYEVTKAVYEHDGNETQMPSFDAMVAQLRERDQGIGPRRFWIVEEDGRVIGLALVAFPELENRDRVFAVLRVLPSSRRRGVGTELARSILPVLTAEGRIVVEALAVAAGGDGEKWALALGFAKVQDFVQQELVIADVSPERWQVPAPKGYRAQRWSGAAPEELVASFARAHGAIADAPTGEATYEHPDWTVERVRHGEAAARDRGADVRTVVAVAEADGQVAALTELEIRQGMPHHGFQLDTAVVPAHRGRGLGRFVKAEMLRWLSAERPSVERVSTNNSADNSHMIRINREVGFTVRRQTAIFEAEISALRSRLNA